MRPYPRGDARRIADARSQGMKPADVVTVVLAGSFNWPSPMVYAEPATRYRWDFLRGLTVVVLVAANTDAGATLRDIHAAEPVQLDVIDFEQTLGWHVVFMNPLSTVRWPREFVGDWLGDGDLHRDLARIKGEGRIREDLEREERDRLEALYADMSFPLDFPKETICLE